MQKYYLWKGFDGAEDFFSQVELAAYGTKNEATFVFPFGFENMEDPVLFVLEKVANSKVERWTSEDTAFDTYYNAFMEHYQASVYNPHSHFAFAVFKGDGRGGNYSYNIDGDKIFLAQWLKELLESLNGDKPYSPQPCYPNREIQTRDLAAALAAALIGIAEKEGWDVKIDWEKCTVTIKDGNQTITITLTPEQMEELRKRLEDREKEKKKERERER